jgi:hypothetical protein
VGVFNRRNAALGWVALFIGKRVVKRKAKQALPGLDADSKLPRKRTFALLLASAAGLATFWRRRSDDEETSPQP